MKKRIASADQHLILGSSNNGRLIEATRFGHGHKLIVILGGIHGDEQSAAMLANAFANSLRETPISTNLSIIVAPGVNPDGLAALTRVNGSGTDINRNFPAANWQPQAISERYSPGPMPASEPETRAIIDLLNSYPPDLLISIHAPLHCINWDGPAAPFAQTIAEINAYPLQPEIGYPTPGSLGSYAGIERQIPTITFELPDAQNADLIINLLALQAVCEQVATNHSR